MNLQGCIPRFCKAHGSLILTILSGIGLVSSVIVTAIQAPKAHDALVEEAVDKMGKACAESNGFVPVEDTLLTTGEKIRIAGPFYLPVILLTAGTLACITGIHVLNKKQQAALMAAYILLQQDFAAYRKEIRDEYGVEADRKAFEASRRKIDELETQVKKLEAIKNVCNFGIATAPGLIFKTTPDKVERAFLHFNRNLMLRNYNDLDELYTFLGLPEEVIAYPHEDYGWNAYENEISWGVGFVDFQLIEVQGKNGEPIWMITFPIPPYAIDNLPDETEEYYSVDHLYSCYDVDEAIRRAQSFDLRNVYRVDPNHIVHA